MIVMRFTKPDTKSRKLTVGVNLLTGGKEKV